MDNVKSDLKDSKGEDGKKWSKIIEESLITLIFKLSTDDIPGVLDWI